MAITEDNRLLITCADRSKLFIISVEDGTIIDILDEPREKGESPEQYFSMKGCHDFGVFPNNTLLIYRSCDRKDDGGFSIPGYNGKWFDIESRLSTSKKLFNSM